MYTQGFCINHCKRKGAVVGKRSYCLFLTSSTLSPSIKTSFVFYVTQVTASLTPSSPPHTPPLLPHHLHLSSLLSNCSHTVQGAHGLDGKPGPVVSGARPVPLTPFSLSPLISCLLYFSASTACLLLPVSLHSYSSVCLPFLPSACLSFSHCLLAKAFCF